MHFRYPRKMNSYLSRLLLCGLCPQQKERDFASVHFNLDTAEIISCSFVFLEYRFFNFTSMPDTADLRPAASVPGLMRRIPAELCSDVHPAHRR